LTIAHQIEVHFDDLGEQRYDTRQPRTAKVASSRSSISAPWPRAPAQEIHDTATAIERLLRQIPD